MEINKLYWENHLATMDRMPANCVDMVLTSPPYDDLRKYDQYVFDFYACAKGLCRILKPGGVIVWVVSDQTVDGSETGTSLKQALYFLSLGLRLHDTMIYEKENFIPLNHNRYEQAWEYMYVFSKGRPKTFNPILEKTITSGKRKNYRRAGSNVKEGGYRRRDEVVATKETKIHRNIFSYTTGKSITSHPAPFPEQLAKDHIHSWSNPGDLVYDPMAGSGTVIKWSHLMQRNWIASEISANYCVEMEKALSPSLQIQHLLL